MSSPQPPWQWDELVQIGTDYEDVEEVRAYDERMSRLRDRGREHARIIDLAAISPADVVLEVGTGTGSFARACARAACRVIAVDVSQTMLAYAESRAGEEGITNIAFHRAGFLTYEHQGEPVDAVVSQLALHHLPDPWKLAALKRLAGIMRPGARLFLTDVVFADESAVDLPAYFAGLVNRMPESSRKEMARHIRDEFSTFDWAMRELLARSGFRLEWSERDEPFLAHYLCARD